MIFPGRKYAGIIVGSGLLFVIALFIGFDRLNRSRESELRQAANRSTAPEISKEPSEPRSVARYKRRQPFDPSGYPFVLSRIVKWPPEASLERIAESWNGAGDRVVAQLGAELAKREIPTEERVPLLLVKASVLNYEGETEKAYAVLGEARSLSEKTPNVGSDWMYTIVYLQAVTSLRRGETENCIMCRGESSCILPLSPAARHVNPAGSRLAVKYFMEYLEAFPDDLKVRWLLNIAHMTLGDYPEKVDPRFRISLDHFNQSEFEIGKFRDVGALVGINRLNQAGGAILEDFNNDDLLDLVFTSLHPGEPMVFYQNMGNGTFKDRTTEAGLSTQLGGLNCVQADFNNDGEVDIFIPRGAWLRNPMRPSLMHNNGNGTFIDVTEKTGLLHPMNTDTAQWADYDNNGWLDLFVCGEAQLSRLYRNKGDGIFEDVAEQAGFGELPIGEWKGVAWFDYDNDRFPDLFLNSFDGTAKLFHNNRNGTFTEVTEEMGIDGPKMGLSCWAWDYDNDGWTDIFANCYDHSVEDVVKGLIGVPHTRHTSKLYRNLQGTKFVDVTMENGLEQCFGAMGSNFGDFDNDGFLDFYLGTGDHDIATLVPNRMLRNLAGKKFVDITSSSGTGHLQKGHGVGCGDYDRDGNLDIAIQMGGLIPGDRYHNVLFKNPGQGNNWLNVKLVGSKSNVSAIGARIKVVTSGEVPITVYRYVCSGSSFGANPLEQMIGLGKTSLIAELEIFWPTSETTQIFRNVSVNQAIQITEFAENYRSREYRSVPTPSEIESRQDTPLKKPL